MGNVNPYGKFSGAKSQVVLAGTNTPVTAEARNFGRTRSGSVQVAGSGLPATTRNLAPRKGGERLFGSGGEINASSKRELIEKIALLIEGAQTSQKTGADRLFETRTSDEYRAVMERRAQALLEAAADKTGQAHMILGQQTGDEVYETMGREGFGRNCLMVRDYADREVNRIRVRKKDVVAFVSGTNVNTFHSMVRQYWVYPGEYYITGGVMIEEREISQAGPEILDDKYQDLLEQFMVQEDTMIKTNWDSSVGIYNPLLSFNTFTPLFFSQGKISVDHWGLQCTRSVLAWDLWHDISAEPEFAGWFNNGMSTGSNQQQVAVA